MSKVIKIKRGLDIKMKGVPEKRLKDMKPSSTYALKPTDFPGITPKILAKEGCKVKAGTPLFFDKYNPEVMFCSPVSGTVLAINRGEKRRILEFVVENDYQEEYESFSKSRPEDLSAEQIKENLLKSGCWPLIRQRPFNIIPHSDSIPRDIFITGFDSAPLAADMNYVMKDSTHSFQTGINALKKLTKGKIFLGIRGGDIAGPFANMSNVTAVEFSGPHPAGNVGVQINKVKPVNKGETVWTLSAADVVIIGKLFETGHYVPERKIALAGSEVKQPCYYKVLAGVPIADLVNQNLKDTQADVRMISGNVLWGEKVDNQGYMGFYDTGISVIPEGNKAELFGWAAPGFGKFSVSRTFFSWLNPGKERKITTKMHGGERPYVVTGEMEKVFPMDIYPMQLLKAIHIKDLDLMEELGIYEVAEEDFALCEVINTSKIEITRKIREGFEFAIKELG